MSRASARVRWRVGARVRSGAGKFRSSFRAAFARRASAPERDVSVGYFSVHRSEPETDEGITDSILERARKDGVVPKIFYSNGAYEYWGRAASLVHISVDGKNDVPPAPETRIYFIAGTQHGPNAQPTKTVTQNRANPTDYRFAMRALLMDMNAWVTKGTAPPDSKIPRIGKDELVAPGALNFPKIPGIALPKGSVLRLASRFRSGFSVTKGLVTFDPPKGRRADFRCWCRR